MIKCAIVGVGFVGLTYAAIIARQGHEVLAYDIDDQKISAFSSGDRDKIESYVYEENLADLIKAQLNAKRLKFTSNVQDIKDCDVFFMCLPTPYKENGESDLSFLFNAADKLTEDISKLNGGFKLFVNKSTVPVGTSKQLFDHLKGKGLENFDVASNPEFLPEGDAVNSAIHAKKVVVGARKENSFQILREVFTSLFNNPNTDYIECNPETSEAIKYASNVTLYAQIVAWQSISGRIGEAFPEVDFNLLRKGVLADSRIAKWGSYVSAGAGGSCFKKDDLSLAFQLEKKGVASEFIRMIDEINEKQKSYLIERAELELDFDFVEKKVAILGTAFKQDTNDIRESNVLVMIPMLLEKGVSDLHVYDPLAIEVTKKHFGENEKIKYYDSSEDALLETDVGIIATDHMEFKGLSKFILEKMKPGFLLIDGRRIIPGFEIPKFLEKGISYLPVGGVAKKAN